MSSIMTGRLRRKRRQTRIEKFHTSSTAQVSPAAAPVEPPPAAAPPPPPPAASVVDYGILELSVVKLTEELGTGAHDSDISELLAKEAEGKNRRTALAALEARLP